MGRLLVFLGVLGIVVGIVGSVGAFAMPFLDPLNGLFNPAAGALEAVQEGPDAAKLCNPGETIVTEGGQSERGPTGDWRHPVNIFCVDAQGNRREVTGAFATDLIGQAFTGIPGFLGGIGLSFCFMSLIGLGVVMVLIGAIIGRRKQQALVAAGGMPGAQVYTVQPGASAFTRSTAPPKPAASDLTGKLRELEAARSQRLVSEDEYQRLRQQLLDRMS
ncbi:MAG: hypothetical protein K8J31_19095 [Anaerolineae bacterium]|nr:hypothetical protein [Anaerolineae bacterium]